MEAFTTQILSRAEFEPPTETKFQHRAMIEYVTSFREYANTTIHLSRLMITNQTKMPICDDEWPSKAHISPGKRKKEG